MTKFYAIAVLTALIISTPASANEEKNQLTHGQVQMTLKVGETTQLEVAEVFGSPNITTIDGSGQEVWIYHRHATVSQAEAKGSAIGWNLLIVGGGSAKAQSGFEQSTRQMTLIIKFGADKKVSDFRSRASSF